MDHKLSNAIKLYKFLSPGLKKRLLFLLPLLIISGFLEFVSLASIMSLGSSILDQEKSSYFIEKLAYIGVPSNLFVLMLSISTLALFIFKSTYSLFASKYALDTAAYARSFFQAELFSKYLTVPYLYHIGKNSSEFIRNITIECNSLDARFLTAIMVLFAEVFPLIFIVSFLFIINPLGLTIATFMFLISAIFMIRLSSKRLELFGKRQMESDGHVIMTAQQSFHSLKEIYLYRMQSFMINKFAEFASDSAHQLSKDLLIGQIPRFILEINALIAVFIIAFLTMHNGASINQVIIQLSVFAAAVFKLLPSASRIVVYMQALNHSKPTVDNIIHQLELPSAIFLSNPYKAFKKISSFKSLDVKDLTFAYDASSVLFDRISFNISKGEVVGLIGKTGTGKTTLVNILLGLIPFSGGRFLVNGRAISSFNDSWSQRLAYVPQDIAMLDDTIANNISFYDEIDFKEVNKALDKVGMLDFVSRLECGINTKLGERGSRLSGGQKQRIGIARALYRNPEILILDEATSALDNKTEAAITNAINISRGNKTIIIIAHRLSSLIHCDKIIELKGNGKVAQFTGKEFKLKHNL